MTPDRAADTLESVRRVALLVFLLLAAAVCGRATAATHEQKLLRFANLNLPARHFTDAVIHRRLAGAARISYHSGVYRTSDGLYVRVFTSDAYPVERFLY